MKHNPKNWAIIAWVQLGIIIGGFSLPNSVINGATWYAPIVDFGRIALLFGFPVGDIVLSIKLLKIGNRKKIHLKQFIDISDRVEYELINPIYFINITSKQIALIELAFRNSRHDLIFDVSFPFESLKKYLQETNRNV
jgi:pilus assembly protein TadC